MKGKCQMCGCDCDLTAHHLIPRVKCHNKYKQIMNDDSNLIMICRQCHDHIHAAYDENYLRDNLSSLELLMADEKIKKFVDWRKKHPDFNGHAKMSNSQNRR